MAVKNRRSLHLGMAGFGCDELFGSTEYATRRHMYSTLTFVSQLILDLRNRIIKRLL